MIGCKKICVIMPAYNAALTLEKTIAEIPMDIVDDVILVDDASKDRTVAVAKQLGIFVVSHNRNLGYGGNQKTCYRLAMERGADIVIMLHPDYQYTPKLLRPMASLLAVRVFRRGAGIAHPRRRRACGWHASLQIRCEPCADVCTEPSARGISSLNTIPVIAVLRALSWRTSAGSEFRRFCIRQPDALADHLSRLSASARSPARRGISRKHRRSISAVA